MGTPTHGPARPVQMPYPFNRSGPYLVGPTYYQRFLAGPDEPEYVTEHEYIADLACAVFDEEQNAFFIRKKPEDAEINIDHLPSHALKKFIDPKTGFRAEECKVLQRGIRIHRGADARALSQKYTQRILPTRYLEKWKDMGDDHDNGLGDERYPKHTDAKSQWIIQG